MTSKSARSKTVAWQKWCRLCAKEDTASDPHCTIYSELNSVVLKKLETVLKDKKLDKVLEKFFSLKISRNDSKPKILCMECINHLCNVIKFNERVSRIENMYNFLLESESLMYSEENLKEIRLKFKIYITDLQQRETQVVTQFIKQETDDIEPVLNKNANVADDLKEETDLVDSMEKGEILLRLVDNTDATEAEKDPFDNDNVIENENLKNTTEAEKDPFDNDNVIENENLKNTIQKEAIDYNDAADDDEDDDDDEKEEYEDHDNYNDHNEDVNYEELPLDINLNELDKSGESEEDHMEKNKSSTKRQRRKTKLDSTSEPKQRKIKHYDIKDNPSFPLQLTCKECNLEIKTYGSYKDHVKEKHQKLEEEKTFKCLQCENTFQFHYRLVKHLTIHAPEELRKSHKCQDCEKRFATPRMLEWHVKFKHTDERPYICEECGYRLRTESNLNDHMLTHMDEKPFECEVCQKTFKNQARLKLHFVDRHTGIEHKCQICGLVLKSHVTLKRHSLVHSSETPHKCDHCGRGFKRKKTLKNHLILHTDLEPYSCQFCPRTFVNGSNCRNHMKKNHPNELEVLEASGNKPQTFIPRIETLKAISKAAEDIHFKPKHSSTYRKSAPSITSSNTNNISNFLNL